MTNKQNYKMKPLMYIVQPDNQDIDVNMQSFVVKKTKPKVAVNSKKSESIVQTVEKEVEASQVTLDEAKEADALHQEETVEKEQSVKEYRKQRKPIMQMNVQEKIEFFTNLPKNMPRTLCLIETTEESYRGVIMTEENQLVTIRSLTHAKPIEIPIEDIKAINLLGF